MEQVLLNLFQVRLRAREAPEGHEAEGTVRVEPEVIHPGDELVIIVEVRFAEGGPPAALDVSFSPPEDVDSGEARVELRHDGATVSIPALAREEVELGTYYAQVVYSDDRREHFEAEAPVEITRHWVRIGEVRASPVRATPGVPIEVTVAMTFEGAGRVRGHVRGRLLPEEWDGGEESVVRLPRERCSVAGNREHTWSVRLPKGVPHLHYSADIEFSSGQETARRRVQRVLLLVPQRGVVASVPKVEPGLMAPGDLLKISSVVENVGIEPLEARVAGELIPRTGGITVGLEERVAGLEPGDSQEVSWDLQAPERTGVWQVRVRARVDRTEGSDPEPVLIDVRPPHEVHVLGAVPSMPWASPGEGLRVSLQMVDSGSRPGHEASVAVHLEGDEGESSRTTWRGWLDSDETEATVDLEVPTMEAAPDKGSNRFALVVRDIDGAELLRVPGAVAVRKRVTIEPRMIKAAPDPMRIGDALLPGERIVRKQTVADLTVLELTSGSRLYTRGDEVAGVDPSFPMDNDFWDDALHVELCLYTDVLSALETGSRAARAEALAMRTIATGLGQSEGSGSTLVRQTRELANTFDPDKRERGVAPRGGPLAPLASWLADTGSSAREGRRLAGDLRRAVASVAPSSKGTDALREAAAAARAAADHLDRLAELLERACRQERLDARGLRGIVALVAAAGVAQLELASLRSRVDPWASPAQTAWEAKAARQWMAAQMAGLLELLTRHRIRKAASSVNALQRAAHAAIIRDLVVQVGPVTGHSGNATTMEVELRNESTVDLELRLNVALPSGAWTVLEPQARGSEGLVFVGPVRVPARTTASVPIVLYVPSTVRLEDYVLPVEIVPEPVPVLQEQGGEDA